MGNKISKILIDENLKDELARLDGDTFWGTTGEKLNIEKDTEVLLKA